MTDKKKKLSRLDVEDIVHEFLTSERLMIPAPVVARVVDACFAVWRRPDEGWRVWRIHQYIAFPGDDPGRYRRLPACRLEITSKGIDIISLDAIDADILIEVMDEWYRIYQLLLQQQTDALPSGLAENPYLACEIVGMMLRAIKPFHDGNRVISWILTNQLRTLHQLPLVSTLPDRELYHDWKPSLLASIEKKVYTKISTKK